MKQSSRVWLVILAGILSGCNSTDPVTSSEAEKGGIESRGMPQKQRPMKAGMGAQASAPEQTSIQMPTWPQKWEVNNREAYGVAFGVTQPGPVTVEVQSQGAPVVVTLLSGVTLQAVHQRSGSGAIRLSYTVTPVEVQRSALWQIRIALAQPGGLPSQADGTIAVQHPSADMKIVRAQAQAQIAQRRAPNPQAEAAMRAQMDASFQAEVARFEQEQTARRAAISAELQPYLQAAKARMQGQIKTRTVEGDGATEPPREPSDQDVATRGLLDRSQPLIVAPQGTSTLKAVLPPPDITWVNRMSGQPGDDLAITGTNFGPQSASSRVTFFYRGFLPNTAQAIRHATCPSSPLVASIKEWNDGLVVMSVPDAPGIVRECPVEIMVTRGSDGAASSPMYGFQLMPAMELRTLPLPPSLADSNVHSPDDGMLTVGEGIIRNPMSNIPPGWHILGPDEPYHWAVKHAAGWFGDKGFDQFFMTKQLRNEWKVFSARVLPLNEYLGYGAYIVESRIGSSSPFISVRTWAEPNRSVEYFLRVTIVGPKGVPHE